MPWNRCELLSLGFYSRIRDPTGVFTFAQNAFYQFYHRLSLACYHFDLKFVKTILFCFEKKKVSCFSAGWPWICCNLSASASRLSRLQHVLCPDVELVLENISCVFFCYGMVHSPLINLFGPQCCSDSLLYWFTVWTSVPVIWSRV